MLQKIVDIILFIQNMLIRTRRDNHGIGGEIEHKNIYTNSTTKIGMNSACTMKLSVKTDEEKEKLNFFIKNIIKKNLKTPENLLDFVESKGTKVFKLRHSDKILNIIGEDEGFITPLKGWKAFYLNLILGLFVNKKIKISFTTEEMFVLRDLKVDIYYMSHQFHKWYGFKMNLPGYDNKAQAGFKKIFKLMKNDDIEKFSLGEIISIKEAIARDVEAIDFVVNLAKENDGVKKSLKKIVNGQGANI